MKIAVISDIHDNIVNLEKCLHWCEKESISRLICCGDVTNSETLDRLAKLFFKPIYLVEGNVVLFSQKDAEKYENLNFYSQYGRFELAGKKVGLTHELYLIKKVMALGSCDIIFYGHTHRPWESVKNSTRFVNPGTLGGVFGLATFAVWNTKSDKIELKLLNKI